MSKFKIGDKVRIISDIDDSLFNNKEGNLVSISESGWHLVNIPNKSAPNTVWFESELELVSDKVPHKHVELIKAWADNPNLRFQVQFNDGDQNWYDLEEHFVWHQHFQYRIKPEPKPDVIKTFNLNQDDSFNGAGLSFGSNENIKVVFDGETGKLKSVEMIDQS